MKRKHFSVEQIVAVLKQAEVGAPVAGLIRKVEISGQTFCCWKKLKIYVQADRQYFRRI